MNYIKPILLILVAISLISAKPRVERADIRHFERYDSTQTCIMTFHRPKNLAKYELNVKKRWARYRRVSLKHTVIITHPICSDKEWYKRGGMFQMHTMDRYIRIFGIKYVLARGS